MRPFGRAATSDERRAYEDRFVARFVPAREQDQVRASFSHRVRPRRKYRDAWSGFLSHLPCVAQDRMIEVSNCALRDRILSCGNETDVYIMSEDPDLDGRIALVSDLLARLGPRAHAFLALCVGERVFWNGEDGCFELG